MRANTSDKTDIQSSAARPRAENRIQIREPTTMTESTERTMTTAMMVGHCDMASTSGVALRTQPMAAVYRIKRLVQRLRGAESKIQDKPNKLPDEERRGLS